MAANQLRRRADIDDAAAVDDGNPIAQALRFFHQMRGEKDRFSARPNAADQIPDSAPRLRIEPRRQLIEKHQLRIVDQRERDEEALFLSARQRHEPGVPLVAEPELLEEPVAVDWLLI